MTDNADLWLPGTPANPVQGRSLNSVLSIAAARLNDKIEGAGSALAQALMAPGDALMGRYDQLPIYEDGRLGMFDPRMMEDAANLAGLVSLGAMPMPRPRGSLGMGGHVDEYGMSHRPAAREEGMTLDNPRYVWGDDIYSPQAVQYFGTLDKIADRESLRAIAAARSNPAALVTIYRAVPKNVDAGINPGDWVTTSRKYAQDHGESWLGGEYRIVEQQVPAGQLATSGDSIHEWGWWPE